eukprot:Colp12_sorted_trinity150504_noHs@1033
MVRPGARWLSPLHWAWKNSAKARLIARVEGKGDVFHHLIAVNGFFDGVLRLLVDKSFRGRLQQFAIEKDGKKVFPVIRAFENAVPDMAFRFVKKETTLNGRVENPLPIGSFVLFKLNGESTHREHRTLKCCAQRYIFEFAAGVMAQLYPDYEFMLPDVAEKTLLTPEFIQAFEQQATSA